MVFIFPHRFDELLAVLSSIPRVGLWDIGHAIRTRAGALASGVSALSDFRLATRSSGSQFRLVANGGE